MGSYGVMVSHERGIPVPSERTADVIRNLHSTDPESWLTNPPGHLWRDKRTAVSGPLSCAAAEFMATQRGDKEAAKALYSLISRQSHLADT